LKVPASCCLPGVGRFRRPSRNDGLVVCLLSTQPWQSFCCGQCFRYIRAGVL